MQNYEIQIFLVIMIIFLASSSLSLWQAYKDYKLQNKLPAQTVATIWATYTFFSIFTVFAALHSFWHIPIGTPVANISGAILCIIGSGICLAGLIAFRSFKRMSGIKTYDVIATGIYQWSRNPQNLGWGVVLMGIALLGRSALAYLMAILFFLIIHIYLVKIEEPYLESVFGEKYREYRSKTPRYLGYLK